MSKERVQFDFNTENLKELEVMMQKCDISTRSELFNNALTVLQWAIEETEQGREIASIGKDGTLNHTLRMPILSHVKRSHVEVK